MSVGKGRRPPRSAGCPLGADQGDQYRKRKAVGWVGCRSFARWALAPGDGRASPGLKYSANTGHWPPTTGLVTYSNCSLSLNHCC